MIFYKERARDKMHKNIYLPILLFIIICLAACSPKNEEKPYIQIGDIVISEESFLEKLKDTSGADVLQQMVYQSLLKEAYSVSKNDVEEMILNVKNEQGLQTDDELEKALTEVGLTYKEFRNNMEVRALEKQASMDGISITTKDLEKAYEIIQDQVRARHILVKDKSLAVEIKGKLEKGADFAELAKKHSIDGTASIGGDVGYFGVETMESSFEDAAFSLKLGQISDPIQTSFGYHIIEVTDKGRTFEEMKDELKASLIAKRQKTADEIFASLLKGKYVHIEDKKLENTLSDYIN